MADLMGGVRYHDAQFDDARMAMTLALTAGTSEATRHGSPSSRGSPINACARAAGP